MKAKAFTLIELLVTLAIVILIIAALYGLGGCSRSNGARVGIITKFSYKGVVRKSYEGELVMGGARSSLNSDGSSSAVANVWTFSVLDQKIVEKVQALQDSGHRGKLQYQQTLTHNPLARDSSYVVVDATDLEAVSR